MGMKEPLDLMNASLDPRQERSIVKVAVLNFENPEDIMLYEFLNNDPDVMVTSHTMSFDHKGTFRIVVFYSVPESKYNDHMKKLKSGDLQIKVSDKVEPKIKSAILKTAGNRIGKVSRLGWELESKPGPENNNPDDNSENSGIQDETGADPVNDVMDKIMHDSKPSGEDKAQGDIKPA